MLYSFLKRFEYGFVPSFIFVLLPIFWVTFNYELFYLLNDEIIFDFVLLLLVLYLNSLISNTNFNSYIEEQQQLNHLTNFILYYLVTSRYFILRKKKYESVYLIQVLDYLSNHQLPVLTKYTNKVYTNIIRDIKDLAVYKLRVIVTMKRSELVQSIKHSYKDKLFILI